MGILEVPIVRFEQRRVGGFETEGNQWPLQVTPVNQPSLKVWAWGGKPHIVTVRPKEINKDP
jgi:hypothetical protein